MIISLSISLNMCCECSKEPSHRDGSFEYPQHMFWLVNKKIIFSYSFLSVGLNGLCGNSLWCEGGCHAEYSYLPTTLLPKTIQFTCKTIFTSIYQHVQAECESRSEGFIRMFSKKDKPASSRDLKIHHLDLSHFLLCIMGS